MYIYESLGVLVFFMFERQLVLLKSDAALQPVHYIEPSLSIPLNDWFDRLAERIERNMYHLWLADENTSSVA